MCCGKSVSGWLPDRPVELDVLAMRPNCLCEFCLCAKLRQAKLQPKPVQNRYFFCHHSVQSSASSAFLASGLCLTIKVGMPRGRVFYRGWSYLIVLGHESCKRMLFPYLDHMLLRLWQSPKEQSSKTLTCRTICGGGRLTEPGHWARCRQSRWHSAVPLCITVSAWVGKWFIFRRRTSQIRQ